MGKADRESIMHPHEPAVSAARAAAIHALVDRIHERVRFRSPPFPFEEFLRSFDSYKVFEVDLPLGLDGMLFITPDGEQKTVHLRRDNPRPRVRFTLAHEIVHAELHFREGKLPDQMACRTSEPVRQGRRQRRECEADFGAAALLMPLWMLDQYAPARALRDDPDGLARHLARVFRVSEAAMRIQLLSRARHSGARLASPIGADANPVLRRDRRH